MSGFPAAHCRVVASEVFGNDAYVLLDTGPVGRTYLYGCTCHRRQGQWFEAGSGNAPSWSPTSESQDVGVLSFWGETPADVDMIRVKFDGAPIDVPVRDGIYFLVRWRVPFQTPWPEIAAMRKNGVWV